MSRSRSPRRTAVLNGHHDNPVLVLQMDVDDDEPPPGTEQKSKAAPASAQLGSHQRYLFERCKGTLDARDGVGRKAVRADELSEVCRGSLAQLNAHQLRQLFERDGLSGPCLLETKLRPFVRAWDVVEEFHHVVGVGVSLV
jgi:hypothetical protein